MLAAYVSCVKRVAAAFGSTSLPELPDEFRDCVKRGCREYAAGEKRVSRVIRECGAHA